ncbi:MAG: 3-deoxy-7-phosphoheptulonate synthase, partial [Clostridia bacterium]|nr:3-deoxy-7-phosphoheptulonate synthase [Clostridia bacterium]
MNMSFLRKLPVSQDIKKEYPVTDAMAAVKQARDDEIRRVFTGESDKLLLVIGPCSADAKEPV